MAYRVDLRLMIRPGGVSGVEGVGFGSEDGTSLSVASTLLEHVGLPSRLRFC
jgi:hypothetical protein